MRMLDQPDPPLSRLLLLPPEIRTLILEELIPRDRCARGYTRVDLATIKSKVCLRQGRLPVSYLRTCRKLYEEGSHFFYSTSVFHFEGELTLSRFVRCRSLPQLCPIQHLQFTVHDLNRYFESWDDVDYALRLIALDVSEVLRITKKLQDIQDLDLLVCIPDRSKYIEENGCLVQIICRLLEYVNTSKIVTVDTNLCDYVKGSSIDSSNYYVRKHQNWGFHWSENFAASGWALLHFESRESSIAPPTPKAKAAQKIHATDVLRSVTWYYG